MGDLLFSGTVWRMAQFDLCTLQSRHEDVAPQLQTQLHTGVTPQKKVSFVP